jgi:hypothetical protein
MALEEIREIITHHKEKCFRCGELASKGNDSTFICPKCSFEWANLFMKRVPIDTFRVFKEYSDTNFCSDYGLCLKNLIDSRANDELIRLMVLKVEELTNKVANIENPKKVIRMVSGKEITKGGREYGKI